jgi:hypothetical protein
MNGRQLKMGTRLKKFKARKDKAAASPNDARHLSAGRWQIRREQEGVGTHHSREHAIRESGTRKLAQVKPYPAV